MAKRGGVDFEPAWVHLDATHPSYSGRLTSLQAKHETGNTFVFSNFEKPDGTESLAKVFDADSAWRSSFENSAIRIYTEQDHHEAVQLVSTWDGV